MADSSTGTENVRSTAGFFDATIWSTILKAKAGEGEAVRQAALERMLARYRQPIFRHIYASLSGPRRTSENAEDLTQDFIHQCLRLDFLKQVSPDVGRFRTFIKTCVKNFLRDQHVRETAEKRGAGQIPASLDETDEDGNRLLNPAGVTVLPDRVLDREWALSVLNQSLEDLGKECAAARREDLFEALKGHLGRVPEAGTAKEIGARLGMSEGSVHTAMNRMRKRLGELISTEIQQTVGTEEDWREELKYLIELLGS